MLAKVEDLVLASGQDVVSLQTRLTAFQALGPENLGKGEAAKADFVMTWLQEAGISDTVLYKCPDERVESGYRPNLVARIPGRSGRMLWLFGHLDVVPEGDLSAWTCDPWRVCEKDGFVYGRGVEDNQQAVCSMMILAASLLKAEAVPGRGLGLVFMADEERGSAKGLDWLLRAEPGLFHPDDWYIVPDGGSPDGSQIEIAEKSQLWLKFTVRGRQCHASTPQCGVNAFLAASRLALSLGGLAEEFPARNPLFEPPYSTFVPTRHDANVDAVNILPGQDVFYMDCRLLPGLEPEHVIDRCRGICELVARETGTSIDLRIEHLGMSSAVPADSPVLAPLALAIEAVYNVRPRPCGIGGATVAAFLRRAGLGAVVWSCIENTCHQPDERSSIEATLKDAAVFGRLLA